MSVVIYAFRSPGSGAVYIGKHEPKVDPTTWHRRGHGRLPDGYEGNGVVVPRFHARHGDRVEWRILAIVPVADWPRAEQRAVHLARLLFGRRCVNRTEGGDGFTRADARALWADPVVRAKMTTALKEARNRPEVQWRMGASQRAANARPEVKARRSVANKEAQNRPEARALRSAQGKARIQTPEGAAALARAQAVAARKRRARKALAPFRRAPAVQSPGVTVWHAPCGSPLGIAGPGRH